MSNFLVCVICFDRIKDVKQAESVTVIKNIFECSKEHLKDSVQRDPDNWIYHEEFPIPFCEICFKSSKKIYEISKQLTEIRVVLEDLIQDIKIRATNASTRTILDTGQEYEIIKCKVEAIDFTTDEDDVKSNVTNENEIEEESEGILQFEVKVNPPKGVHPRLSSTKDKWPQVVLKRVDMKDKKLSRYATNRLRSRKQLLNPTVASCSKKLALSQLDCYVQLEGSGKFECKICRNQFINEQKMKWHLDRVHPQKIHICQECGMKFKRKSYLLGHIDAIHKKILKYKCSTCDKSFSFRNNLKRHEEVHKTGSERKKYHCNICGDKYFTQSSVLLSHQAKFHTVYTEEIISCRHCGFKCANGSEIFKHTLRRCKSSTYSVLICTVCTENFMSHCDLLVHFAAIHPTEEVPYQCPICSVTFCYMKDFENHLSLSSCKENNSEFVKESENSDEMSYYCKTCEETFRSLTLLKNHTKTHGNDKIFSCSMCEQFFLSRVSLNYHEKEHSNRQNNKCHFCTTCNKSFTSDARLQKHQNIHMRDKQICEVCGTLDRHEDNCTIGRNFHEKEKQLESHENAGSCKMDYSCEYCGKLFITKTTLNRHQLEHLERKKKYSCNTCGKAYSNHHVLKTHVMSHTGERPFPCATCGKGFKTKQLLQIHQVIHTGEKRYICPTCGTAIAHYSNFQRHLKSHTGEKPFNCTFCGKAFIQLVQLQTHLRVHTGEKPFLCTTCGKSFGDRSTWHKHEKGTCSKAL